MCNDMLVNICEFPETETFRVFWVGKVWQLKSETEKNMRKTQRPQSGKDTLSDVGLKKWHSNVVMTDWKQRCECLKDESFQV